MLKMENNTTEIQRSGLSFAPNYVDLKMQLNLSASPFPRLWKESKGLTPLKFSLSLKLHGNIFILYKLWVLFFIIHILYLIQVFFPLVLLLQRSITFGMTSLKWINQIKSNHKLRIFKIVFSKENWMYSLYALDKFFSSYPEILSCSMVPQAF